MANYEKERGKITNTQLKKLKYATKNKTETILGMNKEKFQDEELSY